ncbi:MAG TPA: ABC transporter permease [Terracidiphilus sp.]|nr:ABC transporter permease [Terracidiphilus sp.]
MRGWFQQMTTKLGSWLRAVAHRSRLEADMQEELQNHLEARTADLIRAGYAPEEAARRARIELGPALMHKEEMRASLGLRWFDELASDLRYATRMLRKSPGFTLIAVASLALAIGANTTIFTVAKQLLYARLDVPRPDELRLFRWVGDRNVLVHNLWGNWDNTDQGIDCSSFSYPVYLQLRAHNNVMQQIFAFKEDNMNATVAGTALRTEIAMVSGDFYHALEVTPQLGRTIQPLDDGAPGSGAVAVISDSLWTRAFNRSPAVLGQTITLNQFPVTIVGVNPRGFTGAQNVLTPADIFVPLSLITTIDQKGGPTPLLSDTSEWWVNVMGRLKPGVAEASTQAALNVELSAAVHSTMRPQAGETMPRLELADGSRGLHFMDERVKKPMYVLGVFTGLVLLLACANVANLLLARGAQRQREMSVRLALGAGRLRVLRQLLTESLLLAGMGGAGGLLLGFLGRDALPRLLTPPWEPNHVIMPFDWWAFAFTAAITLATGILFGMAPAWMASHTEVSSSLKESGQTATRRRKGFSGKMIVGFQVALSTLLVAGAALFLRSLWALNAVDVGFNADNLVLMQINAPEARYPAGKDVALFRDLEQRLAAVPGAEQVTLSSIALISGSGSNGGFVVEGEKPHPGKRKPELFNLVGNTFFSTMQIPIVGGRGFGAQDTASSLKVAIINEALARERFPGVSPIGKRFKLGGDTDPWHQIVGVVADTHYSKLRDQMPPQFYLPYVQQEQVGGMTFELRTRLSPGDILPSLQHVVQSADRDLPIVDLRTQRQQINAAMQIERTFAILTSSFGLLALALACVGIYGVMAYSVAQRTNEIGIRLALGAERGRVQRMILGESTMLSGAGVVVGICGALAMGRLVKSMLYGIRSNDPLTLVVSVALLLLVALLASWIPARRAAGVEPMQALRHE